MARNVPPLPLLNTIFITFPILSNNFYMSHPSFNFKSVSPLKKNLRTSLIKKYIENNSNRNHRYGFLPTSTWTPANRDPAQITNPFRTENSAITSSIKNPKIWQIPSTTNRHMNEQTRIVHAYPPPIGRMY